MVVDIVITLMAFLKKQVTKKNLYLLIALQSITIIAFLMGMASMVENRDNSTGGHIKRTSDVIGIFIETIKDDHLLELSDQLAIANLKALQARSGEYKQQIAEYDIMISKDPLDQMQIMIDLEKDVEAHNCSLTELTFGEPEKNEQNVNQIAVNLTITGSYRDIITFCHDTVSDKQIKRIDTINITGTDEQRTAQIVLVEFSR